jgi:hypothetical protein
MARSTICESILPAPPRPPPKKPDSLNRTASQKKTDLLNWKRNLKEWPLRRKALLASPWFAERAQLNRAVEKMGHALCARHYPDAPECRIALRRVMAVFSADEISRGPSGSSQAERHAQRALFDAVHRLCPPNTKDGPRKLAHFLVTVLKSKNDWPRIPAGLSFDLAEHFNEKRRLDFICNYYDRPVKELPDEAKCHWWILQAIVGDDDLRAVLTRLVYDAEHRKKGWPHLQSALADALTYITRQGSVLGRLLDFELNFAPELFRVTTQEQRKAFGLDSKSDRSTRYLTRKEHLVLVNRVHSTIARDGSGKSSADTLINRARKTAWRRIESS